MQALMEESKKILKVEMSHFHMNNNVGLHEG
jgi:hypothetical protein